MTPDDLAALLRWRFANDDGGGWLPAAAGALRLNERNLRGMLADKLPIPDKVAGVICLDVAIRCHLQGWQARLPELEALPLSEGTRSEIESWRVDLHPLLGPEPGHADAS